MIELMKGVHLNSSTIEALMDHLYEDLIKSGFLYPIPKRKVMFNNIRNMFLRSNFSSQEIKTFRGILTKLKKN